MKGAESVRHWKTEAEAEHEEDEKHLTVANSALLATAYSRPLEAKNAP